LTNTFYLCIIFIGNEYKNVLPYKFVKSMYMTVNKATFMVAEIINPIIRNSKKFNINTTSLSHS